MKKLIYRTVSASRMVGDELDVQKELDEKFSLLQLELGKIKNYNGDLEVVNAQQVIIPSSEHSATYTEVRHLIHVTYSLTFY